MSPIIRKILSPCLLVFTPLATTSAAHGQSWSVTLYEAENASGLDNGRPFPSLGQLDKPVQNADGGTDLYIGPKAPEGKEANWLAGVPGKGFFAILRLYAPEEAAIDRSWKPGDIEKAK